MSGLLLYGLGIRAATALKGTGGEYWRDFFRLPQAEQESWDRKDLVRAPHPQRIPTHW